MNPGAEDYESGVMEYCVACFDSAIQDRVVLSHGHCFLSRYFLNANSSRAGSRRIYEVVIWNAFDATLALESVFDALVETLV